MTKEQLGKCLKDPCYAVVFAAVKALKELPTLQPQPGKAMENCIEGLACLRVINEYKHLTEFRVHRRH